MDRRTALKALAALPFVAVSPAPQSITIIATSPEVRTLATQSEWLGEPLEPVRGVKITKSRSLPHWPEFEMHWFAWSREKGWEEWKP
jgi:hypothetical protein